MIAALLCVAALGTVDVDMTLTPCAQIVAVGNVAEVQLQLSSGSAATATAVDVILSWDPAEVELIEAIPSAGPWFITGFLNDPDGINADVLDGDALYTALAPLATPMSLPPTITVATFRFLVLGNAEVSMLPSLGTFGTSKVVGPTPGQLVTGSIAGPVAVATMVGTWTDLGGATVGIAGPPTIVGAGTLVGCTPASITLTQGPPFALSMAWVSFAPVPFAALGGVVHAHPFATQLFFTLDGSGGFVGNATWPTGVPPGTSVWFQFFVQDFSTLPDFTMSNGLRATTP